MARKPLNDDLTLRPTDAELMDMEIKAALAPAAPEASAAAVTPIAGYAFIGDGRQSVPGVPMSPVSAEDWALLNDYQREAGAKLYRPLDAAGWEAELDAWEARQHAAGMVAIEAARATGDYAGALELIDLRLRTVRPGGTIYHQLLERQAHIEAAATRRATSPTEG